VFTETKTNSDSKLIIVVLFYLFITFIRMVLKGDSKTIMRILL